MTVATLTNAGAVAGTTSAGIGVDDGSDANGNGRLKVTGSFVNTGDFAVGNGTATPTVTIDALDNQKTGGVDIESGAVTATTLTNEGVTIGDKVAGIGIDHDEDETGGGSLTVTGTFTNKGDFGIGNQGLESAASVAIGTLDNVSGSIDLAGGSAAQAALELAHTATTWQGEISLSGDALLEMKDNGAIETIAQDGGIKIDGDRAFVADANAVNSSSALAGLKAIDGSLDLESGAAATINGALANSGLADDDAGLAVDFDDGDSDSVLTVKGVLTNTGDIGIGNTNDDGETIVTLGGLDNAAKSSIGIDDADVTVKGNVANASAGADEGIGVDLTDGASGGSLTVTGALTNSGDLGVGNASGDDTTKITLGSLDNTAKGSIGFDDAEVIIKGAVVNAGVGADKGIGIGNAPDSIGDCSLMVAGMLTNNGDLVVGSSTNGETTTVELASLDNTAKGSISVEDAAVTVKGNVTNAGVGVDGEIDNGIGVDFVAGDFGGSLTISGALTNTGDFGVGNTSGDKGSTTVTLGSLANSATGSVGIIDATVTVEGDLSNAGVGTNGGIDVGDEDGAKGHSTLTVTKALTNSGDLDVGTDGAGGGDATASAASLTNTGLIDIDDSLATIAVKGDYKQNAGKPGLTIVDGTLSAATVTISGGSLDGAGLIVGKVNNTGGDVQAGLTLTSPGALAIGGTLPGSYTQGKKGKLTEVVTGAKANQFGVIKVNGAVNLGGTLNIEALNGFKFAAGQSFEIMSFAAGHLAGTFSAIDDGSFKSATSGVKIGGGLALAAAYEKSSGQIDLDVLKSTASVATFESEQTLLDEIGGGFAIADTAANIEKGLARLNSDVSHIDTITSKSGVVAASTATFKADEAALNKVAGGFAISDRAAKIQAAFGALEADVAHIKSVSFTGAATPVLNLTKKQAAADAPLLKKISGAYVLNVANAGATTTTGHGDGLTIADVPGDDRITGGGGHETFVFHVGFGNAVLEDFDSHLTGMGHDTVSLRKSEFSYLTAGMSQSQDLAAVLNHAIVGGGEVTILGTAAPRDALTIDGVTKATLLADGRDFRFE